MAYVVYEPNEPQEHAQLAQRGRKKKGVGGAEKKKRKGAEKKGRRSRKKREEGQKKKGREGRRGGGQKKRRGDVSASKQTCHTHICFAERGTAGQDHLSSNGYFGVFSDLVLKTIDCTSMHRCAYLKLKSLARSLHLREQPAEAVADNFFVLLSSISRVVSQPFFVSEPSTESLQMWANEDFFSGHGKKTLRLRRTKFTSTDLVMHIVSVSMNNFFGELQQTHQTHQ